MATERALDAQAQALAWQIIDKLVAEDTTGTYATALEASEGVLERETEELSIIEDMGNTVRIRLQYLLGSEGGITDAKAQSFVDGMTKALKPRLDQMARLRRKEKSPSSAGVADEGPRMAA